MTRTILPFLAALILASCSGKNETPKQPPPSAKPSRALLLTGKEMQQAGINVATVQLQSASEPIALTATIVPDQTRFAKVIPTVPGRIVAVKVRQGDNVREGQTLTVLESIELGEARATYRQAKSEASLSDAAFERAKQLTIDDIIPKKDYLRARADAERAHAALEAAASRLRLLHVAPVTARGRDSDAAYPLVAPFSGTIIEQKAVRGEWVQTDQSLFTVADLGTVWVEADVFEKDLAALDIGMPARILVAAYPGREFSGKLVYLGDTMDVTTRTIKARIVAENPERKLKVGMFATVMLKSPAATSQALIVPEQAVTLVQGQTAVFVKDGQGFDVRAVETESVGAGKVRITTGLKSGERIAVSGIYELKARLLKSQIGSDD